MNVRLLAAGVLLLGVAGAVVVLSSGDRMPLDPPASGNGNAPRNGDPPGDGTDAERAPFQAAADCRSCHEDVWAEWRTSYHGMAWTDPMVQALADGFRKPECIDCHAPMPIFVTGVGERVAPRRHARSDGVDCLSCHLMDDGISVAATRTVDTSATPGACRPVAVRELADATACAGCHNQHETLNELADSGLSESCSDCHMPAVDRTAAGKAPRKGRSHVFPGAHDVEMHRRAASLEVSVVDGHVVARVGNVGAGHHIPTDARHRSYNLFVSTWSPRGDPQVTDQPMPEGEFRLYYRNAFKPSTQIAHGKSRESKWPIPEGIRGKAKVRLVYALNPEELDAKRVFEVHSAEVDLP